MEKTKTLRFGSLAELLAEAIADLKATELSGVAINMSDWLVFDEKTKEPCSVCMAGAVICQRLIVDQAIDDGCIDWGNGKIEVIPDFFDAQTSCMLRTINHLRLGHLYRAFDTFKAAGSRNSTEVCRRWPEGQDREMIVCPYETDRTEFFASMDRVLQILIKLEL